MTALVANAATMAATVPLQPLCEALGASRATLYRARAPATLKVAPKASPRALGSVERKAILDELNSPRFVDCSPAEVFYALLDEDRYLASERTMYRVLAANDEVKERRNQLRHPEYSRPELVATRPNEVWTWDITRLLTTVKWSYLYLYVILDIFSRAVVGWMVADTETAALAKQFIGDTFAKHDVKPGTLVLHADRGTQMTSKTVAQLLADLDVVKSHSRPQVSNDNPFSESQFKTMKYHSLFPGKFVSIDDVTAFGREFFPWYNDEHHHSGIAYLTPSEVHAGRSDEVLGRRHLAMKAAYAAHPERFPRGCPQLRRLPPAVYINPPASTATTQAEPQRGAAAQHGTPCSPPSPSPSPQVLPRLLNGGAGPNCARDAWGLWGAKPSSSTFCDARSRRW